MGLPGWLAALRSDALSQSIIAMTTGRSGVVHGTKVYACARGPLSWNDRLRIRKCYGLNAGNASTSIIMTLTPCRIIGGEVGVRARLPMLAPPLAALLYPFALQGFNASVTRIAENGAGARSRLSAGVYLGLAFAMPLVAVLAAMFLSGFSVPTQAAAEHVETRVGRSRSILP
jgi:hypothetical protein